MISLARTYLVTQRARWPELTQGGVLPNPDDSVLGKMAEQFRTRFLSGTVKAYESPIIHPPWEVVASSYLRYSDANSNPRSLDQQLMIQLERARTNGHFIPWCYVFADAAVTGTTADRHGYNLAKKSLGIEGMGCLYIDEIGRASRDAIESLRLGRLVETRKKRLIGVSDGFDSSVEVSKMMLSMFAMLQEWFIDQLKSKVKRGMDDAFNRGTNIFAVAVGYKLESAQDSRGQPLLAKDGEQAKAKVVEEDEAKRVLWAFEQFGRQGWSKPRIAREFNTWAVGGLTAWDARGIDQLLRRSTYVGIEIFRRTYQTKDPVTGKVTTTERPRKEWQVRRVRNLQIVPWNLWKLVRRRLDDCRAAYKPKKDRKDGALTRADVYPKVLVRPICKSCGAALILGRSGKYASFFCHNGIAKKNGCQLKGYKTVRIVEGAVMAALRERVLVPKFLERALAEANTYLAEIAARPREATEAMEADIRKTLAERDRLVKILDGTEKDELPGLVASLKQKERRLKELRGQLAKVRAHNEPPPPAMTLADVIGMLVDLRGLLSGNVAVAAPLLKELTGPVIVEQIWEKESTKPGDAVEERRPKPIWVAEFQVDAIPIMTQLAAFRGCPTKGTWEYLRKRGWTMNETVVARISRMLIPNQFASEIAAMVNQGASITSVSRTLKLSRRTVQAAVDGDEIDESIGSVPSIWTAGTDLPELPLYMRIAKEVAKQRDEEKQKYGQIAQNLGVCTATVIRAYNLFHKEGLVAAVSEGHAPDRERIPHLGSAVHREIARLLKEGRSAAETARKVGCGRQTVYRVRKVLEGHGDRKPKRLRLDPEQHQKLDNLLAAGFDPATIAKEVGCTKKTVYCKRRSLELARLKESIGQELSSPAVADGRGIPPTEAIQQTSRVKD